MRNLKRLLAVIVAVCTILAFTIPAFAADTTASSISADAQTIANLGVLKGDSADGVTAAYLAKGTTRLQAAILELRLLGKEAEAYAETSTTNFADKDQISWADGQALMAYLHGHPELGWQGTGDNKFDPNGAASAQMIYKVILEVLGYKVGTDFQYDNTITYAAGKGLSKIASVTALTNDSTATALLEALKASTSDGKQTLAQELVSENIITEAAAGAAGLVTIGNTTLDVSGVKAVTNKRVDISLNSAVVKADASQISVANLAVSGVTLSADGKTVRVATAAQTPGTLYTMTVAGKTFTFTGLQADTTKPSISTVVAKTNTMVAVTYAAADLDETTAVNPANYTIAGLTVSAAAFDPNNSKVINLTTSAQTSGKLYELDVANVTDQSGNVIDAATAKFSGHAPDTTKPAVATVFSSKGNTVEVDYTETGLLDEASALNVANYSIDNGLTVTSAEIKQEDINADGSNESTNALGYTPKVILHTSNQVAGKLYTLTVSNVKDASGNVIDSVSKKFSGSALDTTAIGVTSAVAETNTTVRVTMNDTIDPTTVLPANFTFDNGLTVSAATVDSNNATGAQIILTTSSQTAGKLYTLTVANLKDQAGNGVDTNKNTFKLSGRPVDTTKPTISAVNAIDQNTVKVFFSEKLDSASAQNVANYSIDGGLGYPLTATYNTDGTNSDPSPYYVTLTTNNQASQVYTMAVSNVKDLAGNVLDTVSKKFSGVGTALSKVEISAIQALDSSTLQITFNQAMDSTSATDITNYAIANTIATRTNDIAGSPISGAVAKLSGDNSNVVTITFTSKLMQADVYQLTVGTGVTGKYGAAVDTDSSANVVDFAGITDAKAGITVDSVNAIDNRTIQLTFNADLSGTPDASKFVITKDSGLASNLVPAATAAIDTNNDKVVDLTFGSNIDSNAVYYLNIDTGNGLKDISGQFGITIDTTAGTAEASFGTPDLSAPALSVSSAVMDDVNTVDVYFNQPIIVAGTDFAALAGKITITDGTHTVTGGMIKWMKVDGTKLTLFFEGATLDVSKVPSVTFASNASEVKYAYNTTINLSQQTDSTLLTTQFGAVDTANAQPYIVSAQAVGDDKVKITFSEGLASDPTSVLKIVYGSGNTSVGTLNLMTGTSYTRGDTSLTLQLASGTFDKGVTYTAYVASSSTITGDSGVSTDTLLKDAGALDNSVTFSGIH